MKMPLHRLVLPLMVGLFPLGAKAQNPQPASVGFDGTEAFGQLLDDFGLKPQNDPDEVFNQPKKSLVVIFGNLSKLPKRNEQEAYRTRLERFCKEGGALLIATDQPDRGRLPFQLTCASQEVQAFGPSAYRKMAPCPLITAWTDPDHPLCKNLHGPLATNAPSFLLGAESPLHRLASFGKDCKGLDLQGIHELPANAGYIFASPKNTPPAGRAVALAGHGVFLNGMLVQKDNANFAFAWNTVSWLSEGPDGKREYGLFIDDGMVVDNFALPLNRVGLPPVPPIQVVNRMIRGLEEENIFNRLLIESVGKRPYLRALVILASALMLTWAAWRLMHGRFRLDTALPAIVGKWQVAPAAVSVVDRRLDELRRQGNLWEPAQVLARQFFIDHAGVSVPLWDEITTDPLHMEVRGGFWQRQKLKRQVGELWNLASSPPARPVSSRRFDKVLQLLAEVNAAVSEGRLKLK